MTKYRVRAYFFEMTLNDNNLLSKKIRHPMVFRVTGLYAAVAN